MFEQVKKFWNWLWNSNSILSWIASFLVAFIIVRFIFYPILGLFLATPIPLVVVESGSMEHFDNFNIWWQAQERYYRDFGITKDMAEKWPFKSGFNKGDVVIIRGRPFNKLKIGDVIVFKVNDGRAIIHRVIKKEDDWVATKGDANIGQINVEKKINKDQIEGVAVARIPYIGWIKLFFVEAFRGVRI